MDTELATLEMLSEAECLAYLRATRVGRVAVVINGQPAICPVNYVMDGEVIVLRTNWSMLTTTCLASVALQIDGVDAGGRRGWSVMAQGVGHDVTHALDRASEHLQTVTVAPWLPGPRPRVLRLVPETITGQRFGSEASQAGRER
jgi:nitroimidazol reductase NimA-like FMN-containing flavoprotein (pyridoxamine 5'-phosphate oxidase superfamily)